MLCRRMSISTENSDSFIAAGIVFKTYITNKMWNMNINSDIAINVSKIHSGNSIYDLCDIARCTGQ